MIIDTVLIQLPENQIVGMHHSNRISRYLLYREHHPVMDGTGSPALSRNHRLSSIASGMLLLPHGKPPSPLTGGRSQLMNCSGY